MSNDTQPSPSPGAQAQRKRWLAIVVGAFAAIGIAYGAYWAIALRYVQTTDDAYVNGNVVQITPQISGTVVAIGADDTQFVKAGRTLVQLDQADAKVALDQADAQLAKAVREVRSLFATSAQLQAAVGMRQSDLAKANEDLARRERLASSGAVSGEERQHARDAANSARAALLAAQQELEANRARVDRTTVESHPDVLNAAARVRDAYLTYSRTALPAPVSGFVAKRAVQLGQRVGPGAPLMAIVPLDQVWVDANFKEPQLAGMRVGQRVTLTADLYGGKVVYHGKIAGFGAGTGSAFALLPAQNATGNWIKIVQRVPVRIALDAQELAAHPLQIGLSMQVEVDTHERTGDRLPQLAQSTPTYATDVFHWQDGLANERVRAIIAANEPGAAHLARSEGRGAGVASNRLAGNGAAKPAVAARGNLL
ncbi:MAG TPA: efflux RND transporter periplasmic adaptor subunit [Casimicrobiaceae bacterium]|jgi:membrane fusion protein (multidrug efflux system)|nr:efflux RND transporter periplasmic adaptor subunit [Casimicrobiaceae bacterium]